MQPKSSRRVGHVLPPLERAEPPLDSRPVVMINTAASRIAALRRSGLKFWEEGRLEEAAECLAAAAAAAPRDATILAELGSLFRMIGKNAEAMGCFTAALTINPEHLPVWLNAASLAKETGDDGAAEAAFRQALQIDPSCAAAAAGLGLLCHEQNRRGEAIKYLTIAIRRGIATTTLFSCLGQIHVLCGEFAKAGRVFARAVKSFPDEPAMIQQHAQMRLIETAVKDSAEEAVAVYESLAGKTLADAQTMAGCRKAFLMLGAYGQHGAAIRLGQYLLARDPDDLIVEHHLDALTERARDRASPAYLVACFDRHAATFDEHLVEGLKYDVPAKAHALLCEEKAWASNILDIGCGTGLAAPYLMPLGRSITGVDVSAGMLAEARKRNLYDSLVEMEAVAFLEETDENFDLVVALDVLPYTGALEGFFAAVAARLPAGGLFAISHETSHCATYEFLPSGRFAHSPDYIQRLCGDAFALARVFPTTLRLEAGRAVEGNIALLRRVES